MNVLLDTHTFLWWITDDPRLSSGARTVIAQGVNTVMLSVASVWEMAIKAQIGRLEFSEDPGMFLPREMAENGIQLLDIKLPHALKVYGLPMLHRDPFDRLLVAQALVEGLTFITDDTFIRQYSVDVLW